MKENDHVGKTDDEQTNNKMLFHGTTVENTVGILENGFKNSEKGKYGKGLYMTWCSDTAIIYSDIRTSKLKKDIKKHCVFINEVLNSKDMKKEYQLKVFREDQKKMEHPFIYFIDIVGDALEENEENFKKDEKGRIYRFAPFGYLNSDEYRADASVVIPRYYLEFESTRNKSQWEKFEKSLEEYNRKIRCSKCACDCSSITSTCIREC